MNCSIVLLTENPGIDSSLSKVPPVWPKPLPDIFAILPPHAATRGPRMRVVVSATPPVLCLSTLIPGMEERSTVSPEATIERVRSVVSCSSIPLNQTAIRRAAI